MTHGEDPIDIFKDFDFGIGSNFHYTQLFVDKFSTLTLDLGLQKLFLNNLQRSCYPSHDFLGEIDSIILCFPSLVPKIYANVSFSITPQNSIKVK